MTQVYLMLPAFRISSLSESSHLIKSIFESTYSGLKVSNMHWITEQSSLHKVLVEVQDFPLNLALIYDKFESAKLQEQCFSQVKTDLESLIAKYNKLKMQVNKQSTQLPPFNIELQSQPINTSDLQNQIKPNSQIDHLTSKEKEEKITTEKNSEYLHAIANLTNENIKLKNIILFYEGQLEILAKNT